MTRHYEFPESNNFDGDGQAFLFDVHSIDEDTGQLRVRVTQKQIEAMRERRRIRSQEAAQRSHPASQPSVPFRLGGLGVKRTGEYRAGPL